MDKPILFSSEMVKAILEGRKTQTRRVLRKQPVDILPMKVPHMWVTLETVAPNHGRVIRCRYGVPGDTLWVRESWQAQTQSGAWWHEVKREDRPLLNWAWTNPVQPAYDATPPRWLPSIHMPREACRIELEIVNIRAERVQNICAMDAVAEGIERSNADSVRRRAQDEIRAYSELWDKINAARGYGWDVNPWAWVVEFKVKG